MYNLYCGDNMYDYKNQEELYRGLLPAIHVKLKLLKRGKYFNVTESDIWNYLKDSKWKSSVDLTLSDMVQDIMHTDNLEFVRYKESFKKNLF